MTHRFMVSFERQITLFGETVNQTHDNNNLDKIYAYLVEGTNTRKELHPEMAGSGRNRRIRADVIVYILKIEIHPIKNKDYN